MASLIGANSQFAHHSLLAGLAFAATALAPSTQASESTSEAGSEPGSQSVGVKTVAIPAAHRGVDLEGVAWYPTASTQQPVAFGANPVFIGSPSIPDAKPLDEPAPLVLLSHGLGGRYASLAWLGAGLASHGAIVVAVNHPGSTTRDLDPERSLLHGERTQDFTAIIDAMEHAAPDGLEIDPGAIYAAGFSYGGWTALASGGLTANLAGYRSHCEQVADESTHCADLARWGVDLAAMEADLWNQSYKDARVKAVAALDPGLIYGLGATNAEDLIDDVLLLGLGHGEDRLLATDFNRSGLAQLMPQAEQHILAPASHFSALPVCTDIGPAILKEEGDDPVCTDPRGADRAALHARIVKLMAAQFGLRRAD